MEGIVYHGSPNGEIKQLTRRKSTHQKECVYATKSKTIALLFMVKGNGDLDFDISYSDEQGGIVTLVERRPGLLARYNQAGYLYEIDGAHFAHYDYLWDPEVISFSDEPILCCTRIDNILQELSLHQEQGKIRIYTYPGRPSYIPLDNSDLIERYIRYEQMGNRGAVAHLLSIYPEFQSRVDELLKGEKGISK